MRRVERNSFKCVDKEKDAWAGRIMDLQGPKGFGTGRLERYSEVVAE